MVHLNYDGKQDNGVIFNDKYPKGALFTGVDIKPTFSFNYDSMQFSEVFNHKNYIEVDRVKRVMTEDEAEEVKKTAEEWVQPLGQEGNPNPKQIQESKNSEARAYLGSTDWYVTRSIETGKKVPSEVAVKREQARNAILV